MWKSDDLDSVYLCPTRRASEIPVSILTKQVPKSKARPDLFEDKVIAWIPNSTSPEDRNLMAAAPELLEALKALHFCHRAFSDNKDWTTLDDMAHGITKILIAKLTGEQSCGIPDA